MPRDCRSAAFPGFDAVGTIGRAADDGSGPPVGTRLVALATGNAWAELRAVPTSELAVVPENVDPGLASALAMPAVSALRVIRRLDALLGRRLLVTGATGAVGHFAIQLGKLAGAEVIASVRDLGSERRLRDLGATTVVAELGDIAAPVHAVIDTVGGRIWPRHSTCSKMAASSSRSAPAPVSRQRSRRTR